MTSYVTLGYVTAKKNLLLDFLMELCMNFDPMLILPRFLSPFCFSNLAAEFLIQSNFSKSINHFIHVELYA